MSDRDAEHEAILVAVLNHYQLRVPGYGERSVKCFVHDEDNPSCSVNRGKGLWHCHACGAGGGGAQIVMEREHVGYREAMRIIEGWGIETPRNPLLGRGSNKRKGARWVPPRLRETG